LPNRRSHLHKVNNPFITTASPLDSKQTLKPVLHQTCPGLQQSVHLTTVRESEIMLRVADNPNIIPWQRLANERLEVANKLARICAVLVAVLVVLGINSFSVMSEQSRMCSSLVQAHASMDQYVAKKAAND
jgi:hypothetical protein